MTVPAWAGRAVTAARTHMAKRLPAPCAAHTSTRCLGTITTPDQMVVGHTLSRATHPELTWEPSNWRIECRPCSDASGHATMVEAAAHRAQHDADTRHVVLLCGPPAAGKTTYAHTLGLDVYDSDDDQWTSEPAFLEAIAALAHQPTAHAVVIRTGETPEIRTTWANLIRATETKIMNPGRDVCLAQARARGRNVAATTAAIEHWYSNTGSVLPTAGVDSQSPPLPVSLSGGSCGGLAGSPGDSASQEGRAAGQEPLADPQMTTGMGSGGEAVRSAPVASDRVVVPEWLRWDPERLAEFEWLRPLLAVPASASPPLAMTPPHAEAVGTYGWDAVEFIENAEGKRLRWWQKLAIVRQLEHRADGSLIWDEIVESGSRRIGKSVRLRGVALWRLEFGPELFGERQEIVHTGSDLAVCRKAQMEAWRWARANGLKVTAGNGKEAITSATGDAWLVRAQDAVYGLDTTLGLVDEGWKVKPGTVSEGLEPSLMERSSPQLHLTSTAHRLATSMMRSNIAAGLASSPGTTMLLMLWAAAAGADPGDPATWRAASAYWSPARAKLIEKKYLKAMAGEVDPEADDPDPMAGFEAQYLNRWSLRTTRLVPGTAVVSDDDWTALRAGVPNEVPHAVAVEGWPGAPVSVARAWRLESGGAVVNVVEAADVAAAAVLAKWGPRGPVIVGADMADDPAWKANQVRIEARSGSVKAAVSDLTRLLTDGMVRHGGGEVLSDQVLAVRVSSSADGLRVRSTSRADAVKAAVWAVSTARSRKPVGKPRIISV